MFKMFVKYCLIIGLFIIIALSVTEIYGTLSAGSFSYSASNVSTIPLDTALNNLRQGYFGTPISAAEITSSDIGAAVTGYKSYPRYRNMSNSDEWLIFYADTTNIYLITKERVGSPADLTSWFPSEITDSTKSSKYANGSTLLSDGTITSSVQEWMDLPSWNTFGYSGVHFRAAFYLLDHSVWDSNYLNSTYGEWSIGSPTLELLLASLGKSAGTTPYPVKKFAGAGYYGYTITNSGQFTWRNNSFPKSNTNASHDELASPCYDNGYPRLLGIGSTQVEQSDALDSGKGFRPIVKLKETVRLIPNSSRTAFTIQR